MNYKVWATTFAFMLLAETLFLAHDHAKVERLEAECLTGAAIDEKIAQHFKEENP